MLIPNLFIQRINNLYQEEILKKIKRDNQSKMDFYKKIISLLNSRQINEVYEMVETIPQNSMNQEIIKTNYFCLMSIQNNFQIDRAIRLLQQCLNEKQITRITSLFTKCNIATGHRKMQQIDKQYEILNQVLNDHFGQYFILKNLAHKSQKEALLLKDYIFLLNDCLQKLSQICLQNNQNQKHQQFKKACQRLKKHETQFNQNMCKQNQAALKYQKKVQESLNKKINSQQIQILGQKCMNMQTLN